MKCAYRIMRRVLVMLNSIGYFKEFGRRVYDSSFRVFIKKVTGAFPEIKSVYIRNSFADGSWVPWESDIDITIVTHILDQEEELSFLGRFWARLFGYPAFRLIFRHIDIFDEEEFTSIIRDNSGRLSHLRKNISPVPGRIEAGKDVLSKGTGYPIGPAIYRLSDWMYAYRLLLEEGSHPVSFHRYRSSFEKILLEKDETAEPFRRLREITVRMVREPFFSRQRQGLVIAGLREGLSCASYWFRDKKVLMDNDRTYSRDILSVRIERKGLKRMVEKAADDFCGNFSDRERSIRSVVLEPVPFETGSYRMWIILKEDFSSDFFSMLIKYTAGEYRRRLIKHSVFPAIVTAGVIDGAFLHDPQYMFSNFHTARTGRTLRGAGTEGILTIPSYDLLSNNVHSNIPVFSGAIRDALRPDKPDSPKEFCFYKILAAYLFLRRRIIATVPEDIADIFMQDAGSSYEERRLMKRVSKGEVVDKDEMFSFCRNKERECSGSASNERAPDPIADAARV